MDFDTIVGQVSKLLRSEPRGTVVVVSKEGGVTVETPGTPLPPFDRRRHAAAVFVATSTPVEEPEVLARVRHGMRKLRVIR